jgi:hypothetical protein
MLARTPSGGGDEGPRGGSGDRTLEKEVLSRLAAARTWKSFFELDMKEMYFMTAPHRQRQISSQTAPGTVRWMDYPELQTSVGFDLVGEFVTEVVNTFMPEAQQWCERGRGMFVPQQVWDQVKDQVYDDDILIFEAIKASNFYSEIPKSYDPDLSIGLTGMWVDIPYAGAPITCQAIPIRECEVNLGPYGEIDDRFAVRWPRAPHVRAVLGEEIWDQVDSEQRRSIEDGNISDRHQVVFGYWRKWEETGTETWEHTVLLRNKLVHSTELKGEGCCPLLITRFNPTADWPWGMGPLFKTLPDLRQIDELEGRKIEGVGRNINPPITYPSDSFTNIEQGIEDGMAYPIRQGSEGAVKPIYPPINMEPAIYQHEEMEHRMRKLFFIDFPEQSGDTPPTLGQWLDQMARAQRRIGTPGMAFWREGPMQYFNRFKYLLERVGAVQRLVGRNGSLISTRAMNPAQRAAEQQEIAKTVQAIQILGQAFPEEFKLRVDGFATMQAIIKKMRVDLIHFRNANDVQTALDQISKLTGGQAPQGQPQQAAGLP